jgi:hypothetical protein
MNEDGVRWVAAKLGIPLDEDISSTGWIAAPCPFASWTHGSGVDENPSFAIAVSTEDRRFSSFVCQTGSCKRHGKLSSLAFQLGRLRRHAEIDLDTDYIALGQKIEEMEIRSTRKELPEWDDQYDQAERKQHSKPDEVDPLAYPSAVGHPYLGRRGIHWNTAVKLGLLVDDYQKRILFPVRDYRGKLRGYTGRAYAPTFLRNGRPSPKVRDYLGLPKREILLGEHGIDTRPHLGQAVRRIVVVEGLFDYARLVQCGIRGCVALLGSELTPEKMERLKYFNLPIVWMTDPDEAGQSCLYGPVDPISGEREFQKGALHKLYNHVPQMTVEYPRPVDPGELSRDEVLKMLREAQLFRR